MGKYGKVIRVELNLDGITQLKAQEGVREYLIGIARERAPYGCGPVPWTGKWTSGVAVFAWTDDAIKDNLENNTLLKAFGS